MVTILSIIGMVGALFLFIKYLTGFGIKSERLKNLEEAHGHAIKEANLRAEIRKKYAERIDSIMPDDPNLFG
jgi:hypothetical protein|tara:strand:- start:895 stop:1110 length:216 start_codon:yes stop_codon:yes gene_type:complete